LSSGGNGETTSASTPLAALAASRCSASNHTVRAVNRIGPDASPRAPASAASIRGQSAGSHPAGTPGNEPGITCACASISI
jgi:hypothetical protein